MQLLTALIISLPVLAAAAPMPLDMVAPGRTPLSDTNPASTKDAIPGGGENIFTVAVIPPECAGLKEIRMSCAATGVQQCNYIDDAGRTATRKTGINCTPDVDPNAGAKLMVEDIVIDNDEE